MICGCPRSRSVADYDPGLVGYIGFDKWYHNHQQTKGSAKSEEKYVLAPLAAVDLEPAAQAATKKQFLSKWARASHLPEASSVFA